MIDELKKEYEQFIKSGGKMIDWIIQNPEISMMEHSRICGYGDDWLRILKSKAGYNTITVVDLGNTYIRSERKGPKITEYHELTDEWLKEKHDEGYSAFIISKMCCHNIQTIRKRLKKFGYKPRVIEPNPYKNEEWLIDCVSKEYTYKEICALAGITIDTLYKWMYQLNIYETIEATNLDKKT